MSVFNIARPTSWRALSMVWLMTTIFASAMVQAQTIGLNQTVTADFNSTAEFQSLASAGWIFRAGNGTGTQSCASPGDVDTCGFGFATDVAAGAAGAARGKAQGNTEGRWIITPPIVFGNSGTITLVLRKFGPGTGGFDVRESGGDSDTQDMSENEIDGQAGGAESPNGGGPCPPGNSFCSLRNLRSSGAATSGGTPNCGTLFSSGNDGVGLTYCTAVIRATELQNFGTGQHRIAFKLRSAGSAAASNQDMLIDRIVISTGNNNAVPALAWISNEVVAGTTAIGLYNHPLSGHTSGNLTAVGSTGSAPNLSALEFSPDGNTLYGISSSTPYQLVSIDTTNGTRSPIGAVTGFLSSNEFVRSLLIDPVTGVSYVMTRSFADAQSRLYFINLSTGVASLQAGVNQGGDFRASASAIDCAGRLFSVETTNPAGVGGRLYRVDRVSGAVSLIGNTGYVSSLFHGPIDFNNQTGALQGWVQLQSGAYQGYGTYNLNTGAFTVQSNAPQLLVGAASINTRCWANYKDGFE